MSDLLLPSQGGQGDGGFGAGAAGSRPPLRVPILDVKWETERLLSYWSARLAVRLQLVPPRSRSVAISAAWLQRHLIEIEDDPEFDQAAEQIIEQARIIDAMFTEDATPDEDMEGTCREIASACRRLGHVVSKTTVHRWAREQTITSKTMEDERVIVSLQEVIDKLSTCDNSEALDSGTPHIVS
ncbi:hypothetical protein [Corynebacterium belfantii]|uniref:hypothetical protein n=1 Tax=Corynebacterium belfantii TaxID=2014537 RepID=UPI001F1FB091|nr:hypothetical protein [Corynebacterium belfantii]